MNTHCTQATYKVMTILLLGTLLVAEAQGQETSKPWWNPFATTIDSSDGSSSDSEAVRSSSFFNDPKPTADKPSKKGSFFKMPSMPWRGTSSSGSTLKKMTRSTKNMFSSTVDFMNPFDSSPAPAASNSFRDQGYQPQKSREPIVETRSGSGMFGWLWREEKTETPVSVNDWLKQPNPLLAQ